jgi:hypothetical protein
MDVKFKLDSRKVPDGTVLTFGISYERDPGASPQAERKVFTYAMLKAGGFWYVTGGGKVPTAAGWGAVERWLERDGRVVEWVNAVAQTVTLWPLPPSPEGTAGQPAKVQV